MSLRDGSAAVAPVTGARLPGWLAGFGLAVLVTHHLGALPGGLGGAGGSTRVVDWLDLLTPYAVVGTAAGALLSAQAPGRLRVAALLGAVAYVQGHGLHLAANSVGNARGHEAPVHLWDEVVGHWVWYAGLGVLVACLALAVGRRPLRTPLPALLLAAGIGVTWATNGLEGGTAVGSLLAAAGFTVLGWRWRTSGAGRLLLAAFPVAMVVLAGWGALHGGFPQPSEVGLLG